MKKLLITALVLSSTVFAATTSTTVTINGTVGNSCVFLTPTTAASFSYEALTGVVGPVTNGSATLVCNNGTLGTSGLVAVPTSPVTLTKTGGDTLTATVTVTSTAPVAATGVYIGGQQQTYSVIPAAAAGQWGASSGSYTGSTLLTVTF